MSDHAIDSLEACAEWVESLASPTLANDPFIRAADWAAKLIREYASALTLPSGSHHYELHRYDPETQRCTCGALDHPDWGVTA